MLYAVSEMQRLIKKACGAELDAAQGISGRECAIEFRHNRDDSLRYDGYRYFFEGSRLVIEGAVERGCKMCISDRRCSDRFGSRVACVCGRSCEARL